MVKSSLPRLLPYLKNHPRHRAADEPKFQFWNKAYHDSVSAFPATRLLPDLATYLWFPKCAMQCQTLVLFLDGQPLPHLYVKNSDPTEAARLSHTPLLRSPFSNAVIYASPSTADWTISYLPLHRESSLRPDTQRACIYTEGMSKYSYIPAQFLGGWEGWMSGRMNQTNVSQSPSVTIWKTGVERETSGPAEARALV